jgi:tetratricopeptide (TPR) repeat protein
MAVRGVLLRSWASVLLPFVLLAATNACGEESLSAVVKKVKPATVTVAAFNPAKAMPTLGAGFFVAPDRIVSARHVVNAADRAEVRTAAGATFRVAGILAEDRPRDLVLLQIEKPPAPPAILELASGQPDAGERVFTIGTPLGFEWSVSDGVVSAYRDVPNAGTIMQHTAQITVGSSGGPVLDMRGQVVAVQTATMTEGKETISAGQGLNFAVVARHAAALKAGPLRPLAQCVGDLPEHWVPPITEGIGKVSLRPLTNDDFQASLTYFEAATRREPNEPDAWFRLGLCLEKIGQMEKAKESYLKAISLRPAFGLALNNLGAIYNKQDRFDDALAVLRRAVQADEKLIEAHNSMAFALYHEKKYSQAAESAEKALKIDPQHVDSRYFLALCYCHMGKDEKAREQYRLLRGIDRRKADQLKAELDKIK